MEKGGWVVFTHPLKDGRQVSALGFGLMRLPVIGEQQNRIDYEKAGLLVDYAYRHGINYFDTARPYHGGESERFAGAVLSRYPRDSFFLANKMPGWMIHTAEEGDALFESQLERCQVDYFDFYLCHGLGGEHLDIYKNTRLLEVLSKKKAEGKIKRFGFSFHGSEEDLKFSLGMASWDFVQLQVNYLDWFHGPAQTEYHLVEQKGLPCIVMEPVRGGALSSLYQEPAEILKQARPGSSISSWAIRFAASLPNVQTVLSGMSTMEQIQDNISTMADFEPMQEQEMRLLNKVVDLYCAKKTVPCTACQYCMDCPQGVDIPGMFRLYNRYILQGDAAPFLTGYQKEEAAQACHCVACGICASRCPQQIPIPDKMAEIVEQIRELEN